MLLYAIVICFVSSAIAQNPLARREIANSRSAAVDYLLPSNVIPSLYQLELEPDFDTETYSGSINMTLSAISTSNTVTFHTLELEIDVTSISLFDENGNVVNSVLETSYSNDDRQFYTITFVEALEEGNTYILVIGSFSGILNNDNNGFYVARYTNEEGVVRKLATTDFEPTSARRAYPCFDEPALKAQFEISIIRTEEYWSVSNAPLVRTELVSSGRIRDVFDRSPRMSTYLVAFVVSDFAVVADQNQRVLGRPAVIAAGSGDFALSAGINILNIIADYVSVPYSLPKMDQIGIPDGYFDWGAMENWGLVTYRERSLMFVSTQSIAEIIAHEFGHQWFGNIVSPLWWSYIWLNEGFATYFEFYAAAISENFDFTSRIVTVSVQYALISDSSTTTRPMNQDAGSPNDLSALFDTVAYDKGGSVVRMIEGILSTDIFRRGLYLYQNKMQFDAAQPSDLYSSLQEALDEANVNPLPEGADMESVLTTWDSNAGYPLLTVTRNYTDGSVTFSQRRFLTSNPNNDDESIWYVPISYATQSNADFSSAVPRVWLTERSAAVELNDLEADDWIVVNIQQSAFYRINYDNDNWYSIIDFLGTDEANQIHSINRAQLVDDSYVLARYGVIDYDIPLGLTQYLTRETAYAPLQSFVNALGFLDSQLANTNIYEKFQAYILEILETAFESVGLIEQENDNRLTKLNRRNIITWMCAYGHEVCQEYALKQLREWQMDETKVMSPYLQAPLICTALRLGNQNDWAFVFQKYMTGTDPVLRTNLLSSLGCIENKGVLNRYLSVILESGSDLASSERLDALTSVYASGNIGKSNMRNYIGNNWSLLNKRFTSSQLSSMINEVASKLSTLEQFVEMERLALEVNAESIFKNGMDTLKSNLVWTEKHLPSITAWLNKIY